MPYNESQPGPSSETAVTLSKVNPLPAAITSPNKTVSETVEKNMPTFSSSTSNTVTPSTTTTSSTSTSEHQNHSNKKKRNNFWGEARTVLLHREPNESFGISIVGGRVEISHKGGLPGTGNTVSGIFIKSVLPESPAGKSGKMFMGDRVISVNDIDLKDATHEYAVSVIKSATNPVKFVVQSLQSFSVHHQHQPPQQHQQPSTSGTASSSSSSTISIIKPQKIEIIQEKLFKKDEKEEEKHVRMAESPPEIAEDQDIEQQLQKEDHPSSGADSHKTVSAAPSTSSRESQKKRRMSRLRESMRKKLDPESAAALEKCDDDLEEEDRFCYTQDKIKRKYGNLPGEPILIRLENIPPKGLGLSLAGNRDREKNSVFVVDIKSTSPLPLQVNDELLELIMIE
uniref:PDZ domain-containing protein n=1 Tax=Panagrolaimus superbus TaxID=310955 RepID=A0A914Z381_9BILA